MFPLSDPDIHRRTTPYVTLLLIAVNVVSFVFELTLGGLDRQVFFYKLGLIPAEIYNGISFTTLHQVGGITLDITSPIPSWGTVFSSMFLHGGFMHLIGNMAFLWVLGNTVEDRIGHTKYLLFYLGAGLAAALAQVGTTMLFAAEADIQGRVPMIGASGAVSGIMGAYFVLFPFSRINTLFFFFFIMVLRIQAYLLLGLWVLLQFFSGVGSLGVPTAGGVAYWAHLGGFAAGAALVAVVLVAMGQPILGRRNRPRQLPPEDYWR